MKLSENLALFGGMAWAGGRLVAGQVELLDACFQKCPFCTSHKVAGHKQWRFEQLTGFCTWLNNQPCFKRLTLTGGDPQAWRPLQQFLLWRRISPCPPIGVNTALARDVDSHQAELWREQLQHVRVSLDAALPETYQRLRGDARNTPADILRRIEDLRHPNLSTLTVVSDDNVGEIERILELLAGLKSPPRKVSFTGVLGDDGVENAADFWSRFGCARNKAMQREWPFDVSLGDESITEVRNFLDEGRADDVPCRACNVSFHVKSNGDWYPCPLLGGEAIPTYEPARIGNVFEHGYRGCYERARPVRPYGNKLWPCRAVCQYKQLQLNLLAEKARQIDLTIP